MTAMARRLTETVTLFLSLAAVGLCTPTTKDRPTVTIDTGTVVGTTTSLSCGSSAAKFLGIRFGAPPLRFAPPQPASHHDGVYDATAFKPTCLQAFVYPEANRNNQIAWFNTPAPDGGEDEDCLFLNVFAPTAGSHASSCARKAVMVWIYGGGFMFGSGSLAEYDGSSFAANQDVIVVTFNYRTNVFGFPGSPELSTKQQNLGLLDQRLALDWVQRNIAAFGGDPAKVTLFGESAGGVSVDALVGAPPHPVPFRAAIMESGQAAIKIPGNPSAVSWTQLAAATNCSLPSSSSTLACLRQVPPLTIKDIVEKQALNFQPIRDGLTWALNERQDRLTSRDGNSKIARVPVLIGSNDNDGGPFAYGAPNPKAVLQSLASPNTPLDPILDLLTQIYSPGNPDLLDTNALLARVLRDVLFQCTARLVARESAQVGIPTWRYFFNASFANNAIYPDSGAYHSAEIFPVFGTYRRQGATPFQAELSTVMQKGWADFAKDPTGGPGWHAVPELALLGGRATPGADDTGREAVSPLDPNSIDQACPLYEPIYASWST